MAKLANANNLCIEWWAERDRASVIVYSAPNVVLAEWWDDDARALETDGFIRGWGDNRGIVEYLQSLGTVCTNSLQQGL